LGDNIKHVLTELKGDVLGRFNALKVQGKRQITLKELFRMGRQLVGMGKLLAELRTQLADAGRPEAIEAVVTVASPGFVVSMSVAMIGAALLVLLAVLNGIAYLLFM
jgi:hypothetical protein